MSKMYSIKRNIITRYWQFAIGKVHYDYLETENILQAIQLTTADMFIKMNGCNLNNFYYCEALDVTILLSKSSIETFFNINQNFNYNEYWAKLNE